MISKEREHIRYTTMLQKCLHAYYFVKFLVEKKGNLHFSVSNKKGKVGQPQWLSGLALPSAQGVILETLDRDSCRAPCMGPASPSACVSASLSLSKNK